MAEVLEHFSNQTLIRVKLDGGELDSVLAAHAAKVARCDLSAENIKVHCVKVDGRDHSQHRDSATAEVQLMVLHSPGAIDEWTERREQQAAERRAELAEAPPMTEWQGLCAPRLPWRKYLALFLAVAWLAWAVMVSAKLF